MWGRRSAKILLKTFARSKEGSSISHPIEWNENLLRAAKFAALQAAPSLSRYTVLSMYIYRSKHGPHYGTATWRCHRHALIRISRRYPRKRPGVEIRKVMRELAVGGEISTFTLYRHAQPMHTVVDGNDLSLIHI